MFKESIKYRDTSFSVRILVETDIEEMKSLTWNNKTPNHSHSDRYGSGPTHIPLLSRILNHKTANTNQQFHRKAGLLAISSFAERRPQVRHDFHKPWPKVTFCVRIIPLIIRKKVQDQNQNHKPGNDPRKEKQDEDQKSKKQECRCQLDGGRTPLGAKGNRETRP